jgi:hypothetical protein
MKLMTSERCPDCEQIIYMQLHRKSMENDLNIGDGCYLDRDGVLVITGFDEDTKMPDYICIHCGWIA